MPNVSSGGAFLYTAATGVCAGIALALVLGLGLMSATLLLVCSALLLIGGALSHRAAVILVSIGIVACAIGIIRTDAFVVARARESLAPFAGKTATVAGIVTNDPEQRETSLHVNVAATSIGGKSLPEDRKGTLLAIVNRYEDISYGDTVEVSGTLAVPEPFQTDTGHTFDYPGYLSVRGISATMQRATITKLSNGPMSVQGLLFDIKHMFEASVERLFPEPDNALLEGILLGERRGITKDLTQAFIASGLVHVVVLSGHNITIVSEGVFRLLAFFPRLLQFGLGGGLMILFALMTGAGATTIRALAMALIALLARYLGRSALALRSLAVAVAAMALWNPLALLYDPSFVLSVCATFGLIMFSPWIETYLQWVPNYKHFNMRSIVASTLSVEAFILPMLLYSSGVLSFLAVPANALALPVIPPAMLLGFIAGILGFIAPALGFFPMLACDLLLKWILVVAQTTQALPFSTMIVPEFSPWILAVIYIPLTSLAIFLYKKFAK